MAAPTAKAAKYPYLPGYDGTFDAAAVKMRAKQPPELTARFDDNAVYVAGLCPRCRDPFVAPPIPTSGYSLRVTEIFADCACRDAHGRDDGTGCGLRFKVIK